MKNYLVTFLLLLIAFTCIHSNCRNSTSRYEVTYQEVENGDITNTLKKVGVNVTAPAGYQTRQILLSNWFAGHNNGAPAHNFPVDLNGDYTFKKDLPQSEQLNTCEGMYYMFTINYTKDDGTNGIFIGQPKLVMPTKTVRGSTIEQATCPEPPDAQAHD